MSNNKSGGNSHQRRLDIRLSGSPDPSPAPRDKPRSTNISKDNPEKPSDWINPITFALALASWGWSVISPDSSTVFGSLLLTAAVVCLIWGIWKAWRWGKFFFVIVSLIVFAVSITFDWRVIISPQHEKPFRALLIEGYHMTSQCSAIPGETQMPTWMRDQSKEWQARTQQLIGERLGPMDAQTWEKAIVVGTIEKESSNAYQCLWLSNKVSALETIVARNFDHSLAHRDDVGQVLWLNAVDNKLDISGIFRNGDGSARVYINGGAPNNDPHKDIQIIGHDLPVKNGTLTVAPFFQ